MNIHFDENTCKFSKNLHSSQNRVLDVSHRKADIQAAVSIKIEYFTFKMSMMKIYPMNNDIRGFKMNLLTFHRRLQTVVTDQKNNVRKTLSQMSMNKRRQCK